MIACTPEAAQAKLKDFIAEHPDAHVALRETHDVVRTGIDRGFVTHAPTGGKRLVIEVIVPAESAEYVEQKKALAGAPLPFFMGAIK